MAPTQLLATAWTVWKLATVRFGPVGGVVVTVVVLGGLVYLKPWLAEHVPALAGLIEEPDQAEAPAPK